MQSLMSEARKHQVSCICLFTRSPQFFAKLGFDVALREDLPDKINKDCLCLSRDITLATKLRWSRASCRGLPSCRSRQLAGETASMSACDPIFLPKGFKFSARSRRNQGQRQA